MSFFRTKPKPCDFLAIGDCVVDVFLTIEEASVACELKREACKLCLPYGEKVPLKSITKIAGAGNASNVAIGASRLGWQSAIYSIVGNDGNGQEIQAIWKRERVHTDLIQIDPIHETNYHTVLHFQDERTILIYHQPRQYALPTLPETRWVYYTSLGKGHERLESQFLHYLKRHPEIQLVFQPGTFQLRRGRKAITPVIGRTTIFAVNKEEAQRLLETDTNSFTELTKGFHHLGTKIVVITDGSNGSYAIDGKTIWFCPIFPGHVVERTGAGDSYTLGFTYGYDQTGSIAEAMRYGTANSWSVVQQIGPHAGLLSARSLRQTLKKFSTITASEHKELALKKRVMKKKS